MSVRALLAALLILLLAGCQRSATSTRNLVGPSAPTPLAGNEQSVERPYSAHSVFNVDHVEIPEGCSPSPGLFFCPTILSTFGGACSVPAHFMEFLKGTGEMTHGGRVDATAHHCTRVSPTYQITFRDGAMTMVTANGDKVTFSYGNGALTIVGDTTLIDSPFVITGGTGRFEGGSGAGTLHGEAQGAMPADLIGGRPFAVTTTGTITYAPGRGGQ